MEKVTLNETVITGVKIRTNMAEEMNGSGNIGKAWEDFYGTFADAERMVTYGVYTNYSSEDCNTADFDLHIGAEDVTTGESVTIPAGTYLKFTVQGEIPQAVIEEWPKIEAYLNSEGAEKANHLCDFEKYLSMNEAELYISIEE